MKFLFGIFIVILPCSLFCQLTGTPWDRHVIDSSYSGADGVRLMDVNQDNLLDIATGWEEGGYTKVYINPGKSKIKELWPSVIAGQTPSVEDAVFADLDGDNSADVISSTEGNSQKIFINWGPTARADYMSQINWSSEVIPASDGLMKWMYAIPMQVDSVNGIDIIAGAKDNGAQIGWFESPANPKILSDWKWHPISPATWIMSLILRDMDGDLDLDVVTSDRKAGATQGVRWLENPGLGAAQQQSWNNHFIGAQGTEVMFMDMGDLDGDKLEDALVTEYTNTKIHFFKRLDNSGINWQDFEINLPLEAARPKAVKIGDIDGDGIMDIVHSGNTLENASKVGIIWMSVKTNHTDSDWNYFQLSGPEGYKFDRMELIDLDGDGDLDVLTCEENYGAGSRGLGVIWYENPFGVLGTNQKFKGNLKKSKVENFDVKGQKVNPKNVSLNKTLLIEVKH